MSQQQLTIKNLPFRPTVQQHGANEHGQQWFDRDSHIRRYAGMLDALKSEVGDDHWYLLARGGRPAFPLARELKRTITDLVQKCSESWDFYATPDFVTKGAMAEIQEAVDESPRRTPLKRHLRDWSRLSHEHMCPNKQVLLHLTNPASTDSTETLLRSLSFRALISGSKRKKSAGTDLAKLDAKYASSLPDAETIERLCGGPVPLKFYPLLRYHAVELLDDLIPVSARADVLLNEYKKLIGE
ncbi:hypothetical protein LMG19089_00463 [Ralstonia edaphis]|uniref:hypothetical protein n=1 Tax=Ralstonia edaphi TaxID=3058599 RepID=UPI0028F59E6A|nr:hypothetical protein [Ralstonia sp. LMG 6871]CAJ0689273.1 hypothetical protein LMG19089_00463 [Ralstonia sp. LMG 6871]